METVQVVFLYCWAMDWAVSPTRATLACVRPTGLVIQPLLTSTAMGIWISQSAALTFSERALSTYTWVTAKATFPIGSPIRWSLGEMP